MKKKLYQFDKTLEVIQYFIYCVDDNYQLHVLV